MKNYIDEVRKNQLPVARALDELLPAATAIIITISTKFKHYGFKSEHEYRICRIVQAGCKALEISEEIKVENIKCKKCGCVHMREDNISLMTVGVKLERGKVYIHKSGGLLMYTVVNFLDQPETGIISVHDLPSLKDKIKNPLTFGAIKPFLCNILKIVLERGHNYTRHVKMSFKKSDISEILVGPCVFDFSEKKSEIREILHCSGYNVEEIKVSQSEMPFKI